MQVAASLSPWWCIRVEDGVADQVSISREGKIPSRRMAKFQIMTHIIQMWAYTSALLHVSLVDAGDDSITTVVYPCPKPRRRLDALNT